MSRLWRDLSLRLSFFMFPQNVENWGISDKKEMENTNECLESLLVFSVHMKCSREKTPRSSWVWRSFKTFMFLAYADDCLLYYLQVVRGCSDTVIWAIKNLASPVATINIDSEKLGFNIWCRNMLNLCWVSGHSYQHRTKKWIWQPFSRTGTFGVIKFMSFLVLSLAQKELLHILIIA